MREIEEVTCAVFFEGGAGAYKFGISRRELEKNTNAQLGELLRFRVKQAQAEAEKRPPRGAPVPWPLPTDLA